MTSAVFIADLHLDESQHEITDLFLKFLEKDASEADSLYILGDLFEAWIGDDDNSVYNQKIFNALKQYSNTGKKLFFMAGNRDFLIGEKFSQLTGAKILPDPTLVNVNGEDVLLTHGDLLCTDDITHQKYRRIVQHPITKKITQRLPLALRRIIAKKLRLKSRQHYKKNNELSVDVNQDAVLDAFKQHKVKLMIHGHTHKPAIHQYENGKRVVLGAWHSDLNLERDTFII